MKKDNLLNYGYDKYTSTGNDGIIDYIFKNINLKKGIFVEFGAWDGIKNSNCRKLFEEGWSGIFIEADEQKYKELKNNYKKYSQICCLNNSVGLNDGNLFDNIVDPYLKGKI